jgi:3-dehydroquinate synthase
MITLQVPLGDRSYPIYIGSGVLTQCDIYRRHIKGRHVIVVTNNVVEPLYLKAVLNQIADFQYVTVTLPDGEKYKTLDELNKIFETLLLNKCGRNTTLIALGGGVIGDMGGFAAACYQRGIAFIQIPTTLLAQVDSSVGGKTGVNHPLGKNMIGAFYQPQCVIADTSVLDTLSDRELSAGLSEIIKYGLIRDEDFFTWLENNIELLLTRDAKVLAFSIERSCRNKAEVVAADETEVGVRATLNLGHTFGHAIETGMGYGSYLHGEAVAIGMRMAADLSYQMGWLKQNDVSRIIALLNRAKLPIDPPEAMSANRFVKHMAVDKKNIDGEIRLILLKKIGEATLPLSIETKKLVQFIETYKS